MGILAVMASGYGEHGGDDASMPAEVEVEEVTTATTTHVWVVVRPYPLLSPIPIVALRGGMEHTTTAHATAFEGSRVRGFGGSRVRLPGLTPKGSSALGV